MSYPAEWEADVLLSDGATVRVRPVQPTDGPLITAFHGRQSPESIYFRYFTPRPWLSPKDIERLINVDYVDRMAFVALLGDELVGVARYDRYPTSSVAEVAFFTDDRHQGRGIATILLEYLAAAARASGISGFNAQVLPQNRKMLSVFRRAGFAAHSQFADGVIEVDFGIDPTPEALAAIEERARIAYARSVQRLLSPQSIAVVGAGRRPDSIGQQVFRRLLAGGFTGPVYPVNPSARSIASVRAFPSLVDIPDDVDLAVICVPAGEVLNVVAECAHKRVQGIVVVSAGFAETSAQGAELEREVITLAHRHGMRVIGPNSMGVVNTDPRVSLDATFLGVRARSGTIGISSQSGTLGAALIGHARRLGLGISTFVSIGNKADVSGNDLLQYWEDDPRTGVVLLHLESFGNPRNFARITRRLTRTKPVVAVKAGRSVLLNTSRSAGWPVEASLDALLAQTGVIRVDTLEQLFDVARLLVGQPVARGRRVAILSDSAGPALLAADACVGAGLVLAELGPATASTLTELIPGQPPSSSEPRLNPLDLGYTAGVDEYRQALGALLADRGVDAVLVLCTPPVASRLDEVADVIGELADGATVPVVATYLGLEAHPDGERWTVPVFEFPEAAAHALARVARYGEWLADEPGEIVEADAELVESVRSRIAALLDGEDERWLAPSEAADLLALVGVDLVRREFVDSADAGVEAGERIGWPVALKATGIERPARTEAGGVAVDVHDPEELRRAYARMEELLGDAMHPAVVQAMAPAGLDCQVAIHQDPDVGSVVTLGPDVRPPATVSADDVAVQVLPLSAADAERLVARSHLATALALLPGAPAAREALQSLVVRLSQVADALPELATVLLDPVLVSSEGAWVTDSRVCIAAAPADRDPVIRRIASSSG